VEAYFVHRVCTLNANWIWHWLITRHSLCSVASRLRVMACLWPHGSRHFAPFQHKLIMYTASSPQQHASCSHGCAQRMDSRPSTACVLGTLTKDLLTVHARRMCWRIIAQELNTGRTSKQCREHYLNSLRPNMKKGGWTQREEVGARMCALASARVWHWVLIKSESTVWDLCLTPSSFFSRKLTRRTRSRLYLLSAWARCL
jgi:hypothetical protein